MGSLKEVRLGDICEVVKGNIGISKAIPGNFPLVTTGPNRLSHNEFQFDCKAVCIPLVSSAGHGKASLNYVHYQEGKFALGNILCACIPFDENNIDVRYLHLYLQTFKNDLLVPLMRGMANVSLTTDKIKSVEVFLPDLPIQKNIVARLQSLQSLHREADTTLARLQANVKRLRQSILQEAIQGKLVDYKPAPGEKTGAELLADIRAEKERRAREAGKKPEAPLPPVTPEEMPFEVPGGWVWCRLGELASFLGGFAFQSSSYVSASNFQVIRLGNVKNDFLNLESSPVYVPENVAIEADKFKILKGDILITMTGTRRKKDYCFTLLVNDNYLRNKVLFLNQRVGCLRFDTTLNSSLFNIFLKNPLVLENIFKHETGTVNQGNIGSNAILNCPIPILPTSIQNQIVVAIESRLSQLDHFSQQLAALQIKTERLWKSELQQTFKFEDL